MGEHTLSASSVLPVAELLVAELPVAELPVAELGTPYGELPVAELWCEAEFGKVKKRNLAALS